MGFGKEYHRGEMPLSSCHIREYMTSTCFITLITWLKWLLPDIPTIFPYPYSSLWNIGLILIDILKNIFRNLCSTMREFISFSSTFGIFTTIDYVICCKASLRYQCIRSTQITICDYNIKTQKQNFRASLVAEW